MLYKKMGVTRNIQFSQHNCKLPLPQKQGDYPVIPIYGGKEGGDNADKLLFLALKCSSS